MPRLWKQPFTTQSLSAIHNDTAVERLRIEFLAVGADFRRARQHNRVLHGGVSRLLAPQRAA